MNEPREEATVTLKEFEKDLSKTLDLVFEISKKKGTKISEKTEIVFGSSKVDTNKEIVNCVAILSYLVSKLQGSSLNKLSTTAGSTQDASSTDVSRAK